MPSTALLRSSRLCRILPQAATTSSISSAPSSPACARSRASRTSPRSYWTTSRTRLNLELKGLKLYLWSFRDQGVFHEAVTNEIVDDMVGRLKPRFLRLTARWYVRGGLFTTVVVEHRKRGWKPCAGHPPGPGIGHPMPAARACADEPATGPAATPIRSSACVHFWRSRAAAVGAPAGAVADKPAAPVNLSIGEPRHATPEVDQAGARVRDAAGSPAIRPRPDRPDCARLSPAG